MFRVYWLGFWGKGLGFKDIQMAMVLTRYVTTHRKLLSIRVWGEEGTCGPFEAEVGVSNGTRLDNKESNLLVCIYHYISMPPIYGSHSASFV